MYIRTDWNLPGIDCVWTPVIALSLNHSYLLTSTTISWFLLNATRFLSKMIHSQEHYKIHCSRNSLEHLFTVMTANTQVFNHIPHDNFTTSTHACSLYTTTTTLLSVPSILTCLELAIPWPVAAFDLTTHAATTYLHLRMHSTMIMYTYIYIPAPPTSHAPPCSLTTSLYTCQVVVGYALKLEPF